MAKKLNPDHFATLLQPVPTKTMGTTSRCQRCGQAIGSRGWASHRASHDMKDAKAAGVPYVRPTRPGAPKRPARKAAPTKVKAKNRFK